MKFLKIEPIGVATGLSDMKGLKLPEPLHSNPVLVVQLQNLAAPFEAKDAAKFGHTESRGLG